MKRRDRARGYSHPMQSPCRGTWILSVALLLSSSCKDDDKPVADPLEDPWVDGLEAIDEQPNAEPNTGEPVAAGSQDPSLAELGSLPEAQPAADLLATPSAAEPEPEPEPASAHALAGTGKSPTAPATAPEPPTAETQAVDGPVPAPEPASTVEPTPTPEPTPAKPASPPPITRADFHGSYRYAGGSSQRNDLAAGIEATVDALNGAIQGIARRRLTATNPLDSTVDIVVAGDDVTTTFESGFNASCVIDGATANARDIEGGKLRVRLRWKDGKLIQQMEGNGGARTIVYVLSADRKTLTVHHKITSDRLPVPLIYRLSYSRKA